MIDFQIYLMPLLGGFLIGCAVLILMLSIGRIAGISGITSSLLNTKSEGGKLWRIVFIIGLILGPFILNIFELSQQSFIGTASIPVIIISGFLVGFGSHLGNGCTSGHGVCGIGRFSKRSLLATCSFMTSAMITVYIIRHLLGA